MIGFDTVIAAHLLNENLPLNLQDVGSRELSVSNWGKGVISFGETDKKPPSPLWGPEGMGTYCARDAAYAHLIFHKQAPRIKENNNLYNLMKHLILPGMTAVLQMEINGIWVDRAKLLERQADLQARTNALEQELLTFVPETFRETLFAPPPPPKLLKSGLPRKTKKKKAVEKPKKWFEKDQFIRKWFFGLKPDGLGLKVHEDARTPKGLASVDKKSLGKYAGHPVIDLYLKLNDMNTELRFFVQWLKYMDENDRLHPSFNMTGTVTGRRSCTGPNLQQVPRNPFIRSIIGAPPGWKLLEIDYSQIEVRLVSWFAREETMMAVFRQVDGDIYSHTAARVLKISERDLKHALEEGEAWAKEARQKAKAMVLGFLYGMSASSFGEYAENTYHVTFTSEECVTFRNEFFREYPALLKWHEECKLIARQKLEIQSLLGRVRHLVRVLSNENREKSYAERQAINSPVQGTGADFILMGLSTLHEELNPREVLLVGDIHDALLVQIKEEVWEKWATHILNRVENPPGLAKFNINPPIPMLAEAKIGNSWGEGKKWRPSAI